MREPDLPVLLRGIDQGNIQAQGLGVVAPPIIDMIGPEMEAEGPIVPLRGNGLKRPTGGREENGKRGLVMTRRDLGERRVLGVGINPLVGGRAGRLESFGQQLIPDLVLQDLSIIRFSGKAAKRIAGPQTGLTDRKLGESRREVALDHAAAHLDVGRGGHIEDIVANIDAMRQDDKAANDLDRSLACLGRPFISDLQGLLAFLGDDRLHGAPRHGNIGNPEHLKTPERHQRFAGIVRDLDIVPGRCAKLNARLLNRKDSVRGDVA
jgi:hypothetical protein